MFGALLTTLRTVRAKLCSCKPDYFVDFDSQWFEDAGGYQTTVRYLRALEKYMFTKPWINQDTRRAENMDMYTYITEDMFAFMHVHCNKNRNHEFTFRRDMALPPLNPMPGAPPSLNSTPK